MKEHLLLFRNASAKDGYLTTTQDMAEEMPRWQAWIGNIAMQGRLVSTAPIEYAASVVTGMASAKAHTKKLAPYWFRGISSAGPTA